MSHESRSQTDQQTKWTKMSLKESAPGFNIANQLTIHYFLIILLLFVYFSKNIICSIYNLSTDKYLDIQYA